MRQVACGGLAHEQRARHVRAVAAHLRPEVEQQHLAGADRRVAGRAVRQRRARARQAGDIEGQRLGAVRAHLPLEVQRQLAR